MRWILVVMLAGCENDLDCWETSYNSYDGGGDEGEPVGRACTPYSEAVGLLEEALRDADNAMPVETRAALADEENGYNCYREGFLGAYESMVWEHCPDPEAVLSS